MEFASLQYDPACKVPTIERLLNSLPKDNLNSDYYNIAEQLGTKNVNSRYALVSLRKIVEMCFLHMESPTEEDLKPQNSYKWLYLIHKLSSRQLSEDKDLENQKIVFVLQSYMSFIQKMDIQKSFAVPIVIGVLCAACRLIDKVTMVPDLMVESGVYDSLLGLLNASEVKSLDVSIDDFQVDDLFAFASPLSLEYVKKDNVFENSKLMLVCSVLRLMYRIIGKKLPENVDDFKKAIQPYSVNVILSDISVKVLISLFGGDEVATYRFTDACQYERSLSCITALAAVSKQFKIPLTYDRMIDLATNMDAIYKLSEKHPAYWVEFVRENKCIDLLTAILFSEYDSRFLLTAAKLIKLSEEKMDDHLDKILKLFITSSSKKLKNVLSEVLLFQPNETAKYIMNMLTLICNYGANPDLFFEFIGKLLQKVDDKKSLIASIVTHLEKEYVDIDRLPNAHIYRQLAQYIDVSGAYLNTQPCTVCNNPRMKSSVISLNNTEFNKYEHDTVYMKLSRPLFIKSFIMNIDGNSRDRHPRIVKIYVSGSEISERNDLTNGKAKWYHVADMNVSLSETEVSVALPLGVKATCVKLQYDQVWEISQERVCKCPQCGSDVPNRRSGICPSCGENCYQCKNCRHIPYGTPDPVLCVECGRCNIGNISWKVNGTTAFSHTQIDCESDCEASLTKCDELLSEAHEIFEKLDEFKDKIEIALLSSYSSSATSNVSILDNLYNSECKSKYQQLTKNVQHVYAIRLAVAAFKSRAFKTGCHCEVESMCYNCKLSYIRSCIKFFVSLANIPEALELDIPSLLIRFASESTSFTSTAVDSLISFCSLNWELTLKIVEMFIQSLPNSSQPLVRLMCALEKLDDDRKADRWLLLVDAVGKAVEYMNSTSSFNSLVLQPLVCAICNSPVLSGYYKNRMLINMWNIWSKKKVQVYDPYDMLLCKDFAKNLLFKCSSDAIRAKIADVYAIAVENGHLKEIASIICDHIEKSEMFTDCDIQAYDLLASILSKEHMFLIHTLSNGMFQHIVKLFDFTVEKVLENEGNIVLNLSIGSETHKLMQVLKLYMSDKACLRYIIECKEEIICQIITVYFKIKTLMIQRSKYLDDTLTSLKEIIMAVMQRNFLLVETEEEKTAPEENGGQSDDDESWIDDLELDSDMDEDERIIIIMERREMIREERRRRQAERVAHTVRRAGPNRVLPKRQNSSMVINNNGPRIMLSSAVNAIQFCPDVIIKEISSIIFPAPVAMKVPIVVQKSHTQEDFIPGRLSREPSLSDRYGKTMRDIKAKVCMDLNMHESYIQDEHSVELLVDGNIIALDLPIEDVYKKVWCAKHGNDSTMIIIFRLQGLDGEAQEPMISSFPAEETAADLLAPELKYEYTSVLCGNGFTQILAVFDHEDLSLKALEELMKLMEAFLYVWKNKQFIIANNGVNVMFRVMKNIISTTSPELFVRVISVANALIKESKQLDDSEQYVSFIMESLKTPVLRNNTASVLGPLLSLLTPIVERKLDVMKTVVKLFVNELAVGEGKNIFDDIQSYLFLDGFSEFLLSLPPNDAARDVVLTERVVPDAVAYICEKFPLELGNNSDEWKAATEIKCIPMALKILTGMALNHGATHELFMKDDARLIRVLLILETISSGASIGEYAEACLKSAMQEPSKCLGVINEIKQGHSDLARQRAEAEKAKVLQEANDIDDSYLAMLEELEEQEWECCICREGYGFLPKEPLGVYVYANRMDGFANTATYFTCVHSSCHKNSCARNRDDRVNEWEDAKVRNSESPCNNIFPLPSESLDENVYRELLVKYLDVFKGRDITYAMMPIMDLETHFRIVSRDERIANERGGGSLQSIAKLWVFFIYASHVFMSHDKDSKESLERELEQLLEQGTNTSHAMVLSMVLLTMEEWEHVKSAALKRLVKEKKNENGQDLMAIVREPLIFFTIVNKIQQLIKSPSGKAPVLKENGHLKLNNGNNAEWMSTFKHNVLTDGPLISGDFGEFAQELGEKILKIEDLADFLIAAGVDDNPDDWIMDVLSD